VGEQPAFHIECLGPIYAAAISRVALIGSFSTLQSADKFVSRGRLRSVSHR
jgi:hypothetical protein